MTGTGKPLYLSLTVCMWFPALKKTVSSRGTLQGLSEQPLFCSM
jgi:hypothetical protein